MSYTIVESVSPHQFSSIPYLRQNSLYWEDSVEQIVPTIWRRVFFSWSASFCRPEIGCDGSKMLAWVEADIVWNLPIFLLHLSQLLLLVIAGFLSFVGCREFGGVTFLEIGSILLNG